MGDPHWLQDLFDTWGVPETVRAAVAHVEAQGLDMSADPRARAIVVNHPESDEQRLVLTLAGFVECSEWDPLNAIEAEFWSWHAGGDGRG